MPSGLPPRWEHEDIIMLKEETSPISVRPYLLGQCFIIQTDQRSLKMDQRSLKFLLEQWIVIGVWGIPTLVVEVTRL